MEGSKISTLGPKFGWTAATATDRTAGSAAATVPCSDIAVTSAREMMRSRRTEPVLFGNRKFRAVRLSRGEETSSIWYCLPFGDGNATRSIDHRCQSALIGVEPDRFAGRVTDGSKITSMKQTVVWSAPLRESRCIVAMCLGRTRNRPPNSHGARLLGPGIQAQMDDDDARNISVTRRDNPPHEPLGSSGVDQFTRDSFVFPVIDSGP